METQKTQNSQSNHEKEEWSWRNQLTWFQTILQNYIESSRKFGTGTKTNGTKQKAQR